MVNVNGKIYAVYTNLSLKIEALNARLKKVEVQVVQTGNNVKRHETFIKGNEALKYHVNAIIEDDFWQLVKEEMSTDTTQPSTNILTGHGSTLLNEHWSTLIRELTWLGL